MKSPCGQHVERKVSRRVMLRGLVYSALTLTGSVAYAQSDNLEIVRLDVPVKGLPPVLDGFSIGVMTDFHAGGWGNETVCSHAIASMQQLNPDLIALLGDYIDGARSHNRQNIANGRYVFQQLALLKAPYGVYAVLGNHDHWADSKKVTELLAESKITVLKNENRMLENGLILAGVDDYWEGPGNSRKALAGVISEEKIVVMLSHNPDITRDLEERDPVRLVLAGHTHGGQIRVPFTNWAPWVPCSPRYRGKTGLLAETKKRWSFISKGVGAFLLPVRFSCPPDIALLTLKRV